MRGTHLQCVFQTLAHLQHATCCFYRRQRLANLHEVSQVSTFHEFHREKMKTSLVADVVDRHDEGMNKPLTNAGFSCETGNSSRIFGPAFTKKLESHDAIVVQGCRAKYSSKTSGGVAIQQLVTPQNQAFSLTFEDATGLQRRQHLSPLKGLQDRFHRNRLCQLSFHGIPVRWGQQS